MSRTDKTRPFWVKMIDAPGNYREVHNHGKRMLLDESGNTVSVPLDEFYPNGQQKHVDCFVDHPQCDLPELRKRDERPYSYDACHYTYTSCWVNTGMGQCGCPVCNDSEGRKQDRRKSRRQARQEAMNYRPEDY